MWWGYMGSDGEKKKKKTPPMYVISSNVLERSHRVWLVNDGRKDLHTSSSKNSTTQQSSKCITSTAGTPCQLNSANYTFTVERISACHQPDDKKNIPISLMLMCQKHLTEIIENDLLRDGAQPVLKSQSTSF